MHVFVSRLHKDTTVQDLITWLDSVGICNAVCRKIEPKDGRVFNTAAFKVSCDLKYSDKFYDEGN